jgi:trafficking protein particle complex subunit 10
MSVMLTADKQLTWFTRTGGTSPGDDSANILDLSHKDYRNLILANNISLFDFRVYLFARQSFLLTSMRKYADICSRAKDYIATLARTLRNDREDTGISFIESWIFSAAMQVIETTRKAPKSHAISAATGDLLVIARTQVSSHLSWGSCQLDKLGHHYHLIPDSVPFEGPLSEVSLDVTEVPSVDKFKTTNPTLKDVVTDEARFFELYEV